MNDIIGLLSIFLIILVLPWALLIRSRRLRLKLLAEYDSRFADLTRRMYALETAFEKVRDAAPAQAHTEERIRPDEAPVEQSAAASEPVAPPATFRDSDVPEQPAVPQVSQPAAGDAYDAVSSWIRTKHDAFAAQQRASEEESSVATPTFIPESRKRGFDLEETLGTNWLNKIGIVILVFGIAFFLAYQVRELGPLGKVLVGYVASATLLGGGLFLERRPGYSVLARAGVGGGWALTFFTTYAMYHVDATRVLTSQGIDLVLMGIVAAGMVGHSLRYRSQVVTGLAFLLAFSTVTISHVTVYSLIAGVVLSAGLIGVVLRMKWYELELLGIAAAYLNHFYWVWHIIDPMNGHKHPFPEFVPSSAILLLYWLAFRFSYIVRRTETQRDEAIATAAALMNSFCLLAIFRYQSVHPEWAFWALLVLGSAEVLMSLAARARRRVAFAVLASIGATLLFAAIPFRFSGMNVSVLWIAFAETLLAVGIATRETVFRRLSFAAMVAAAGQMLAVDVAQVAGARWDDAQPGRVLTVGLALLISASVVYLNATYVQRRWSDQFEEFDSRVLRLLTYFAFSLLASGLWVAFPGLETAAAWAIAAVALAWIGSRASSTDLRMEGDLLVASAFVRAIAINLNSTATWGAVSQRLVTIGLCAVALYVGSRLRSTHTLSARFRVPALYTWAASTLVGLLIWYELRSLSIAAAWALFGLVLLEFGLHRKSQALRLQSYIALLCSIARVFVANLNAPGLPGQISPRMYSTVPVIAILAYVYAKLSAAGEQEQVAGVRYRPADIFAWGAVACFIGLVRFEVQPDWVAAAWALTVPALLGIAWRSGRLLFLQQGIVIALLATFRAGLHNLYERSLTPGPFFYGRAFTVSVVAAILFAALALAYKLKDARIELETSSRFRRAWNFILRRPEQILFFAPFVLVVGLLGAEMNRGMLTVSWSVFGVLTFLFALWLGERSFRLAGLGLLLLGVGKIVVVDVWSLGPRDRYITFICMGAALLLVSFLYTRFREAIRQYL